MDTYINVLPRNRVGRYTPANEQVDTPADKRVDIPANERVDTPANEWVDTPANERVDTLANKRVDTSDVPIHFYVSPILAYRYLW